MSAEITMPLLTNRDALTKALTGLRLGDMERVGDLTALEIADAVLSSGVVRDAASLADDEVVVALAVQASGEDYHADEVRDVARHLAAALAAL